MQLVSQREDIPERPSDFTLACRLLRDVIRLEPHCNYLWTDGRWMPAKVDDIMRRANTRRKSIGDAQFNRRKEWLV